ncbi:alpha/beta hydrolase [Halonotius terrestris]|uniref:Alpha/beta hydrolase n=1 Tax=Halonotius terrestris TaxID=2487750 RepID=A0A8J8PAS8_9EURY|nr:alpha/beta fold hydrolase [Halonotius terrestris]TQQ82856.1 alpha/beta hydrolase [Halonotius terrestris]
MTGSPTRRQALRLGGVALTTGIAGCLGEEPPEGTLDFSALDHIDWSAAPSTQITTSGEPKPEFREYRADDEPSTLLVLHHNATLDGRALHPLASAIANTGVAHVVTPDIRGHGPDPLDRGDLEYIYQPEDDLTRIVETENVIQDPRPIDAFETIIVGGHGAGGGLATRVGASGRSFADAFLFLAPHLGRSAPTTRPGFGGWEEYSGDRMTFADLLNSFNLTMYNQMEVVDFDMPQSARYGDETLSYTYRLAASLVPGSHTAITQIDEPTLTLIGSDDEALVPEAYETLLADDETSDLQILDGLSHLDVMVHAAVLDPIVEWIERVSGQG